MAKNAGFCGSRAVPVVAKVGESTARWACKSLVRGVCARCRAFARPAGREKCEKSLFRAAVGLA